MRWPWVGAAIECRRTCALRRGNTLTYYRRKAATSASSAAQILLTSLRLIEAMPRVRTRSSTRLVLTPRTYASWITAKRARSVRRRGSRRLGKCKPSRTRGIATPDRAYPGIRALLAIPVLAGQPALGIALTLGPACELGGLGLHDRLGEHPDTLT